MNNKIFKLSSGYWLLLPHDALHEIVPADMSITSVTVQSQVEHLRRLADDIEAADRRLRVAITGRTD